MSKVAMLTYLFRETDGTKKMRESVERQGYALINCCPEGRTDKHNMLPEMYKKLFDIKEEYDLVIYTDAGDTYWQLPHIPQDDLIIYSAEKACYPIPELAVDYPLVNTPWKYLNSGNFCGPTKLIIEFFEKYGLNVKLNEPNNDQALSSIAFLKAIGNGFPITLDYQCHIFQSIAFGEPGELIVDSWERNVNGIKQVTSFIHNTITKEYPCVLHGNGLTPMDWIYKLHE